MSEAERGASVPKAERGGDWRQFAGFFRKVRLSWGWILLSLAVSLVYYVAVSFIPGSTAALFSGDLSTSAIVGLVVNYGCTLVLSLLVSVLQVVAQAKSTRSVRDSVWRRMMGVTAAYYDEHEPSELLSAVTSDAENTVSSLITAIVMVPSAIMYLVTCLVQISFYNTSLLAVLFVLVPVYVLYAVLMGRWQYRTGRSIQVKIGGLTGFLAERIRNLALIKTSSTEDAETEGGEFASTELYRANVQLQYINGVVGGYTMVTEAVGVVVAVLWGCQLLRTGQIDLQAWLAFFLFVPMVNTALRQLSIMWSNVKDVQGRASRMSAIMDAPQEEMNESAPDEVPSGDIALEDVTFSYGGAPRPVLDDVSITIPAGKVTAVVGPSGSGKTTLLRLIERLYDPTSGTVTTGGADVRTLNLSTWRRHLSYVNQDAALFSGTVREALCYGVEGQPDDGRLWDALAAAGARDFVEGLPGRFDADLSLWGGSMSSGQRQRMVIARELLRSSDVLLLDEPTSTLDAETAASVSETVYERFAGRTIVTVTHELAFVAGADKIVVLDGGHVVGEGTHEQLMESCPTYRDLVEEQSYQEVFA